MSKQNTFPALKSWTRKNSLDSSEYERMYIESIKNPDVFWEKEAERLDWTKKWRQVKSTSFQPPLQVEWFPEAELNVCYNCVDRHLPTRSHQTAIIFEPDDPKENSEEISYESLHKRIIQIAGILKKLGVKKNDRITLYMPLIPDAIASMLACARLGAIHSVVFAGFSAQALADRINNSQSTLVITCDAGMRGGKLLQLKKQVDTAATLCPQIRHILTFRRRSTLTSMQSPRDIWVDEVSAPPATECTPVKATDGLFILYTSGSTGQPKGILHSSGGYLLYAAMTHELIFDYHPGDIFWCTADIGWITGHSYVVYGPLSNGATILIHEGTPFFPTVSRHWEIIDKHSVTQYYTAPTVIRSLMREGSTPLNSTNRDSLRLLGTVGEPINPEAWLWFFNKVGKGLLPIVDTWWQTETGGICLSTLPAAMPMKPGFAGKPFFGIKPAVLDENGQKYSKTAASGRLCLESSWPGQMLGVYNDPKRFNETYFSDYPGKYFTGDGVKRDEDGYYQITGRIDDVLNVSGHRIGTADIESALVGTDFVAEAAVIGYPHPIKGQAIYAFVTVKVGTPLNNQLKEKLRKAVKIAIGSFAAPEMIQWAPELPKTRSGKIMRRILRKIVNNEEDELGDVSTLAESEVVNQLIANHKELMESYK